MPENPTRPVFNGNLDYAREYGVVRLSYEKLYIHAQALEAYATFLEGELIKARGTPIAPVKESAGAEKAEQ